MSGPLPKPARVEKWQRWESSVLMDSPAVVRHINGDAIGFDNEIYAHAQSLLREFGWTFLGYAKPPMVEVGQRWRCRAKGVIEVTSVGAWVETRSGERFGHEMRALDAWEYLGMAESVEEAKQGARNSDLNRYGRLADAMAGPEPLVVPCDPKVEARRANEEAAKRLIENPPEWAYPTAWRCAVLAAMELESVQAMESSDVLWIRQTLETYQRMRTAGRTVNGSRGAALTGRVGLARVACEATVDAYSRGMERPTLLGRPGVKGGVSTCDLGVEYE